MDFHSISELFSWSFYAYCSIFFKIINVKSTPKGKLFVAIFFIQYLSENIFDYVSPNLNHDDIVIHSHECSQCVRLSTERFVFVTRKIA